MARIDVTSLIDTLFSAGIAGDATTISSPAATFGIITLAAGDAHYTAPASGSAAIYFTVGNTLGQTGPRTIDVTVDLGPVAGTVKSTLDLSGSIDLTSAILSATTAGLKVDTLTITADSTLYTLGSVTLFNGDLVYRVEERACRRSRRAARPPTHLATLSATSTATPRPAR